MSNEEGGGVVEERRGWGAGERRGGAGEAGVLFQLQAGRVS